MDETLLPRFEATRRRDFLKRAAALGAAALVPGALAACSKSDEDVFASATTAAPTTTAGSGSSGSTTAPTTSPATDAGSTSTTTGGSEGTTTLPTGAELEVAFTYTPQGGGGFARNPFIVVWVETPDGDLVATASLWYNPPKGNRWVNELTNWYAAESAVYDENDGSDLDAVTGATRPAGSYSVAWDGTDHQGDRVAAGEYVVFVESAREHGPHSLTSATITLGPDGATVELPDDGELSSASARYAV